MKIKLIIPFFLIFLLTGCYNYRELNQLAITSAMGIDKVDKGYTVTIQVTNTQKYGSDTNSSGSQPKFITYTKTGETIQDAIRNVILECPRRLYANHMSILVIGEKVATNGIKEILDFFARNTEFRKQFTVILSKSEKTTDILNILTPLETLNAKKIKDSIITDNKYLGVSQIISFEQLLNSYLNKNTEFVLPTVKLIGSEKKGEKDDNIKESKPDSNIILEPLAVFKNDELLGYLTEDESIAYSYVKNTIKNSIITSTCKKNQNFTVEIIKSDTKIKTNGKNIDISIKANGNIKEIHCDIDLSDPKKISDLQKIIEKDLKKEINKLLDTVINKYNSDIIGFKDLMYKKNPKEFKELKKKYKEDLLKNLEIKVNTKVDLLAKGNIIRVIKR